MFGRVGGEGEERERGPRQTASQVDGEIWWLEGVGSIGECGGKLPVSVQWSMRRQSRLGDPRVVFVGIGDRDKK